MGEEFQTMSDSEIMAWVKDQTGKDPLKRRASKPSESVKTCPICGREKLNHIMYHGRHYCECAAKISAAQAAIRRVDGTGEMTFETIDSKSHPTLLEAAGKLQEIAVGRRRRGIFMFGLPGRGKTHLSVAAARGILANGRLVSFYSLAELVSRIQETYGYSDSPETKTRILDEVASHDVVILDDIGKEHRSSDVESIVYRLIDALYRAQKTLIASSNLPGKDFVARYDGAVLSRLGGMCEKIVIKGEDRREAKWDW